MDEFQQAMAALGQAFVAIDTDGDGQPDTMVPANQGVVTSRRPVPQATPMPPSSMYGMDPSEDMGGQPGPDWQSGQRFANMVGVTGAAAADPFGISSAALGYVSPAGRDTWRNYQASEPVAAMTGGMVGGLGAAGAAFKGARGVADMAARGGALGAGSDVMDYGAGVTNALGPQTAVKGLVGAGVGLPMRYAAPAIGTAAGISMAGATPAAAQNIEQRLRAMSPQELQAYQQSIGVAADGRLGPDTMRAARAYEQRQAAERERMEATARADRDARMQVEMEQARQRGAAETEAARIRAQGEADIARQKAEAELSASNAQRPFLQQFPGYSGVAPYVAGAAAAALPFATQLLLRRGQNAPVRQASREVDNAAAAFSASPNALSARGAEKAVTGYGAASARAQSFMDTSLDVGSVATGALLPSAAVTMPYVIDYNQPAGTPARTAAENEFTLEKMGQRLIGPATIGASAATAGRIAGGATSRAFGNPAPRAGNLSRAQVAADLSRNAPDDAALTQNINSMLRGAQENEVTRAGLRGLQNAPAPRVRYEDQTLPSPIQRRAEEFPQPRPSEGIGGNSQTPLPPPEPGPAPFGYRTSHDHMAVSRQYLDELLTNGHPSRSAIRALAGNGREAQMEHMADQLAARYAARGLPPVPREELLRRANESSTAMMERMAALPRSRQITNPAMREDVLNLMTRHPTMLSLPIMAGGAGMNALSAEPYSGGY